MSRKSVLPVFKELNSILFYPVQYEGEEMSKNVFYTGAAPNQQAIPAVDYLMANEKVQRWVLAGTDYVYPRTTNKILRAFLKSKGVADKDIDAASLRRLGFYPTAEGGRGGPFETAGNPTFKALFNSWKKLDSLSSGAIAVPSDKPVQTAAFMSGYGVRADPFSGAAARHMGIDLAGPAGTDGAPWP